MVGVTNMADVKQTPLEDARTHWGPNMPDWVETLAIACGETSRTKVAAQLDRSPAVISQVLRKLYPASYTRIEERVRGVFQNAVIECPALGPIPAQECQDWRAKSGAFAIGNPLRQRMYRACNNCPRNQTQKEADE